MQQTKSESLPISSEEIQNRITNQIIGQRVFAFGDISSTNEYAKRLAREGAAEGCLVIAEHQTKGRGRFNRAWHSARGKGLWFSIILRPAIQLAKAGIVSILAAVSVAEAVEKLTPLKTELKWPNDVLIDKKKVCGILIETEVVQDKLEFLILGIGINVSQVRNDFPEEVHNTATSLLLESKCQPDRVELLLQILNSLDHNYKKLKVGQTTAIINQWSRKCFQIKKQITIQQGHREIEGVF